MTTTHRPIQDEFELLDGAFHVGAARRFSPRKSLQSTAMALVVASCGLVAGAFITKVLKEETISAPTKQITPELRVPSPQLELSDESSTHPLPRIAWLMSFPNSGTSYTVKLVKYATLQCTATNYGEHHVDNKTGVSFPVFENSPFGPFWSVHNPLGEGELTFPDQGYVLTKTHCGARCVDCGPSHYLETQDYFTKRCLTGKSVSRNETGELVRLSGHYDATLVHKAIHLFRNPFNNAVSRFHLHLLHIKQVYTNDRDGFRKFCEYMNHKYLEEDEALLDDVFAMVKDVPCYGEFIRYVRWHNLAATTARKMHIPTLVLHYENYETNFDETLTLLLKFLEQDQRGPPADFMSGKSYLEYYTDEEKASVATMMKAMAYPETWGNISHYFVGDSFQSS